MTLQPQVSGTMSPVLENWPEYLEDLHARIAHRFRRPEVRERVQRYLTGLLGDARRKNGWQMAEAMGQAQPRGTQRLLNGSHWDADAVRDDLREYVVEHLGDQESGVLIVDETGFLKKGNKSVGVARQYTGTAGNRENCQVGVFLCYASEEGAAFIDRALYLPREWTEDSARREEAGVPEEVRFATKGKLATEMLRRAFEAGVSARWVVADTLYGNSPGFARMAPRAGKVVRAGDASYPGHLPRRISATGAHGGKASVRGGVVSGLGREGKQGRKALRLGLRAPSSSRRGEYGSLVAFAPGHRRSHRVRLLPGLWPV
jgi:SRSO17 transposase